MINGDAYLFEYKRDEGTVVIDRVRDDLQGVEEKDRETKWKYLDVVEPFYLPGQVDQEYFLTYSGALREDPNVMIWSYSQGPLWTLGTAWQGKWSSQWDIIKPFSLNGLTYLFEYQSPLAFGNATVAIDLVQEAGHGTGEIWRGEWSSGWTSIEPFYLGEKTYLVEHKGGSDGGLVAIDQVNAGGRGTTEVWRGKWPRLWSLLRVFYRKGKPYVLVYNSAIPGGGDWTIYRIRDDLQGFITISSGEWISEGFPGSIWQIVEPFYKAGQICFLAHDMGTRVEFARLNDDMKGISRAWSGKWSRGWTKIKPFYIPPAEPHP